MSRTDKKKNEHLSPSESFPIVGIGASAGGLAAFEAFFSGMPVDTDPGMAFVLVQHLAPDHKSILTDLVKRYTRMEVFEVEDGMVLRPNCAYIIPPNRDMALLHGTLQLLEPRLPRGLRLPIDYFFRSLAQDQGDRSICVILSGTGSDGTLGLREVKEAGGMVMVQNPASCEFDGMPKSALSTNLVDYTLPPVEMPSQIMFYVEHAFGSKTLTLDKTGFENALKKIFILLRSQTGHDFSQYKPNTLHRRIERRMVVQKIDTIEAYVKFLQQTPGEVEALFRDLLIGVTNFFRDPEAFKLLEDQVIPKILEKHPIPDVIRIWSPGCATGEEAYSLAILLAEYQVKTKKTFKVLIFATDIDPSAITKARAGIYPRSIAAEVSETRLSQFFIPEPDGDTYRIHKSIRDMIVFSEQDLIKDPPFTKLDLVSCRNLLIYLGVELQKKVIPLFHYALNPQGVLFLGSSETVGEFGDLFSPLDRRLKIYQRNDDVQRSRKHSLASFIPPMGSLVLPYSPPLSKFVKSGKLPLKELTEQALLQQLSLSGVLVNSQGDVLYLHGRTGLYLEPAPGEAGVNNILSMAREGLHRELNNALQKALGTRQIIKCPRIRVKTNGHFTWVNLTVRPVVAGTDSHAHTLFLVILEEVQEKDCGQVETTPDQSSSERTQGTLTEEQALLAALKLELQTKEEYIQITNEELKSSMEEMQSVNEELQSTNEELETSKEELQSVNEELATVNVELQSKVTDLSRANNDMNNLLSGTGIATIFVDLKLLILRYTPSATQIINFILSDLGRPIYHVVSNLKNYTQLEPDIKSVLENLETKEVEVQSYTGTWYLMRILPYRTLENVVEGAVITFVNITGMKEAEASIRRLAVVVRDANDAITLQDMKGNILAWNPGATRIYGWSEHEALGMNNLERIPPTLKDEYLHKIRQLSSSETLEPYRTQRITKSGQIVDISMTSTALINAFGETYGIATTERLTENHRDQ